MDSAQAIDILRESVYVSMKLGAPVLILCMGVGILIAIFQAATQIHEQTLTFVPKLLVIVAFLLMAGSWMLVVVEEYTEWIFSLILNI